MPDILYGFWQAAMHAQRFVFMLAGSSGDEPNGVAHTRSNLEARGLRPSVRYGSQGFTVGAAMITESNCHIPNIAIA